jgi:hypothetical protein
MRENVPDGKSFAIFVMCAFYLICGGCRAPQKIFWKCSHYTLLIDEIKAV